MASAKEKFLQHLYDNAHNFKLEEDGSYVYKTISADQEYNYVFIISRSWDKDEERHRYEFSAKKQENVKYPDCPEILEFDLKYSEMEDLYLGIISEDSKYERVIEDLDI